jgi:hypothetical protein
MCLAGRTHSTVVQILLVVVGVQAFTPDASNLASFKGLNILFDAADCSGDPGNTPDEVSGPCRFGESIPEEWHAAASMDSTLMKGWPDSRAKPRGDRPFYPTRGDFAGTERTCRLTC